MYSLKISIDGFEIVFCIHTWCKPEKTGGLGYKLVDLHSPRDQKPEIKCILVVIQNYNNVFAYGLCMYWMERK